MPRTYAIRTFGCQMNEHDSSRAAGLLETIGYRPADSVETADLVLVNTCAVRENADNKLYGTLGHLRTLKAERGTTLVVGGCLAQKDGATVAEKAPWVDVVFGTHNLGSLPDLLLAADSATLPVVELVEQLESFPSALPAKRDVRHHAWVSISVGCNNSCSFCIVPSLRGPEVSRRVGDIVGEVQALVADDVVEVTLLGQNVNSYGRDLEVDGRAGRSLFADLLRALGSVPDLERVRFTSPHPRDFTLDVLDAMAETTNVCEHLHLPLQSGSDRLLKAMRRSYRAERYMDLVRRTRELMPEATLTTDIIVGFPGETDEDFAATMAVVEEARFEQAYTFKYSPRPGTDAAMMVDDFVDDAIVTTRYHALEALTRRHSLESHQRLIGSTQELLVQSPSKTDPTRLSGYTRGHHLVHLPADDRFAPGDLVTTEIREASTNYMIGSPAIDVRRTRAGRATEAALARGEGWQIRHLPPTDPAPESATRRRLPVLPG